MDEPLVACVDVKKIFFIVTKYKFKRDGFRISWAGTALASPYFPIKSPRRVSWSKKASARTSCEAPYTMWRSS